MPNYGVLTKLAASLSANPVEWGTNIIAETINRLPELRGYIREYIPLSSDQLGNGVGLITLNGQRSFIPIAIEKFNLKPIDVLIYLNNKELKFDYLGKRSVLGLMLTSTLGKMTDNTRSRGVFDAYVNIVTPAGFNNSYGTSNLFFGFPASRNKSGSMNKGTITFKSKEASDRFTYDLDVLPKEASFDVEYHIPAVSAYKEASDFALDQPRYETDLKFSHCLDLINDRTEEGYQYAFNRIKESELYKTASDELQGLFNIPEAKSTFLILSKEASDYYKMYYPNGGKDGVRVSFNDVVNALNMETDPSERATKAASIEAGDAILVGGVPDRTGNIFIKYEEKHPDHPHKRPTLPHHEGVFMFNGMPIYINPNVKYYSGEESTYALGVAQGEWTLAKQFKGFEATGVSEFALPSKEVLLPEIPLKDLEVGRTYTIYNQKNEHLYIPFTLLEKNRDTKFYWKIKIKPLLGLDTPIDIYFDKVDTPKKINEYEYLFSEIYTRIRELPSRFNEELSQVNDSGYYKPNSTNYIHVELLGNGDHYSLIENKKTRGPLSKSALVFELVNRYGFAIGQANEIIKEMQTYQRFNFMVKSLFGEADEVAQINKDITPASREKEAIDSTLGLAEKIANFNFNKYTEVDNEFIKDYNNTQIIMNYGFNISKPAKLAAMETEQPKEDTPQQRADSSSNKLGLQPQVNANQQMMQYLSKISQVDKTTAKVKDMLMFYSLGGTKKEQTVELLSQLNTELKSVLNHLCKLMVMINIGGIPGQDYQDIKTLAADIDSYLSSVTNSIVLVS